jgi:hypothetical protein
MGEQEAEHDGESDDDREGDGFGVGRLKDRRSMPNRRRAISDSSRIAKGE